ncbi:Protein of unknown function [Pyronema omphalodes CBS 100304]|uniref:Uncharacterized protein n=1 Tax=Pyronema omphalodes (strain CBS 100304) TaxID=1076935 RepID=U4L7Q6_PYROM|nr:Protein of unknown function [Pyronema omphalodes CBS 100304]
MHPTSPELSKSSLPPTAPKQPH